ncbi:MAG: DUF2249 domain-containing protein [Alteromonadaceae bacterium]|nr:DUF2249 domain-containing protein [Alteromonadaceae bacterium]
MKAILLNVSELPPPEPMIEILSALASLPQHYYLKVFHSRVPYPLFERLTANNWAYQYQEQQNLGITLYIYHKEDQSLFEKLNTNGISKD